MVRAIVGERFRIGEFELDAETGELRRTEAAAVAAGVDSSDVDSSGVDPDRASAGSVPVRLSPQPARLLVLLARREGALVTREEIRHELWDGVEVEFETSLHYCVRQVRAALGDTASSPRYVETLPRRGYRLLAPVTRLESSPAVTPPLTGPGSGAPGDSPIDPEGEPPRRSARTGLSGRLVLLLVAGVVAVLGLIGLRGGETGAIRIGVMPFERAGTSSNGVAEAIVERLASRPGLHVVGPTTTASFAGAPALRPFALELELGYLVNARFLDGDEVLAEIIRVEDGAHVWVERYRVEELGPEAAETVARAMVSAAR